MQSDGTCNIMMLRQYGKSFVRGARQVHVFGVGLGVVKSVPFQMEGARGREFRDGGKKLELQSFPPFPKFPTLARRQACLSRKKHVPANIPARRGPAIGSSFSDAMVPALSPLQSQRRGWASFILQTV